MTTTDLSDGQPARILIFDQCPLFARALSELIGEQVPGSVRRITHNANDALEEARNEHPDLVFIDLDGGDIGVTLLKDIKLLENAPRCVMLITDGTQPSLMAAIRLQADGFITKRLSVQQLAAQVHLAAGGEMVISDSLTAALAVSLRNVPMADDSRDISRLSPREVDVLYCIANGMSNRQISEHLKISDGTVKVHVKHVLKSLVLQRVWKRRCGRANPGTRGRLLRRIRAEANQTEKRSAIGVVCAEAIRPKCR